MAGSRPPLAICLTGHRALNKRMSLFIEGLLKSGCGVTVVSMPRGNWSCQRFENLASEPEISRFQMKYSVSDASMVSAIFCFHWCMLPLAVMLGLLQQAPVIYDEHDHYELNVLEGSGSWVRHQFLRWLIHQIHRWCLPRVTLVTCIHMAGFLLRDHLSRYQSNILELHNFPVSAWKDVKPEFLPDSPLSFLYIGGVYEEKGVEQAALAFERLPPELRHKSRLHIFGSGDSLLLSRLANRDGISVHNSLPPARLREFARNHRCCGLVLYNEHPRYRLVGTNSRKLYEYLALGMPVISTTVGELPEFINSAQVGLTIDAHIDVAQLSAAMASMLSSEEAWHRYSRNAIQLMTQDRMTWEYEWQKVLNSDALKNLRRAA